ncbi:MAG TPA: AMP-binding protein, partial [Bryobacteraceae bacterium]
MSSDRNPAELTIHSDRPWLDSYPIGISHEIDCSELPTLKELLERACSRYGTSIAFIQGDRAISFRQLDQLSQAFGAWLQSIGVQKGNRVALLLPNICEFPIALFGALRAGVAVVTLNPSYTPPEIEQLLHDAVPDVLVILGPLHRALAARPLPASVRYIAVVGGPLDQNLARSDEHCQYVAWTQTIQPMMGRVLHDVNVDANDLAFIQYTGGTTGTPKGAMLTHRNLCANVLQSVAWIHKLSEPRSTLITLLPLYHIFALEGSLLLFTYLGWTNVLIPDARNMAQVIEQLLRHPVAFVSAVNSLLKALLEAEGFASIDFSNLRITLVGGMPTDPVVAQRWSEITHCPVTQAWGLTEASPGVTINLPGEAFNSAVGLPLPSTDVEIRDLQGARLPIGEVGELCVRGPQVSGGYWRRESESANAFWPGGWLRTGDAGRLDVRGFVHLIDRF